MKCIKYIIPALLVCLTAMSCVTESHVTEAAPEDEVEVRFVIRTTAPARPVSRAVYNPLEYAINDLTIIALRSDGNGGFVGDYIIPVEDFEQEASSTVVFTIPLYTSETEIKLLFIANSSSEVREYLELHAADFGELQISEAELRVTLIDKAQTISMTGEVTLDAITPGLATTITVPLIRSIAKVDMLLKLSPGSHSFEPQVGYIYRSNELVQAFPNLEALDDPLEPSMVVAPSVPAGSGTERFGNYVHSADPETGAFFTAYVTESVSATTFEERSAATCIVIGGSFDGGPITYYRVDFNSGEEGHPFGQILRNYYYVFNITEVSAPGADDPDTVAENILNRVIVSGAWERVVSLGLHE